MSCGEAVRRTRSACAKTGTALLTSKVKRVRRDENGVAGGKSAATLPFFPSAPAGFSTVNGFPQQSASFCATNARPRSILPYPGRDVASDHSAIAKSTLSRDADGAVYLLVEHYRLTGEFLSLALQSQFAASKR